MKYFKYADFRMNLDNVMGYCPCEKIIREGKQLRTFFGKIKLWEWDVVEKPLHYIKFMESKDVYVRFPDEASRDRCLLKLDKFIKIHDFKITKL